MLSKKIFYKVKVLRDFLSYKKGEIIIIPEYLFREYKENFQLIDKLKNYITK